MAECTECESSSDVDPILGLCYSCQQDLVKEPELCPECDEPFDMFGKCRCAFEECPECGEEVDPSSLKNGVCDECEQESLGG